MRQVIICDECGGENILQREWVYVNDGSTMIDSGPTFEYEDQWCNDCNKHVDFKEKSDNPK